MMMTIMIRYSGDDDDGDNYDNIQVTMIRYSGDGPLLGSAAKSSSLIPTPCRFSIILLLLAYQVLIVGLTKSSLLLRQVLYYSNFKLGIENSLIKLSAPHYFSSEVLKV